MVCSGLESITDNTIRGFLRFPTSCDPYFYAKFIFVIWTILVAGLYINERRRKVSADIISAMGVASIAIIVLSVVGTALGIIETEIMIGIIVCSAVFIALWMFKK